jgi:hypothetical protein
MENIQDILNNFHTLIGDGTELSTTEELALLNKIYSEVLGSKQWEFLKKEKTGLISGTEVNQPADFSNLTDDLVIYLGENNNPFKVIPFTERRLYKNNNNFCYYDARQGKFVFLREQNDTYNFDYIYNPDELSITPASNPVFPNKYWGMLSFFMASDNSFIQLDEKARSYSAENRARGQSILDDMKLWNDKIIMMSSYGV